MREVRDFILNELSNKIHAKHELEEKVQKQFNCDSVSHLLELTMKGKIVQVNEFLIPFNEYTSAKENVSRLLFEDGKIYLPLLKPNSAESHLVDQMIASGKLREDGEGNVCTVIKNKPAEGLLITPDIVYLFRKRGFIDLKDCTDKRLLDRFRRLVRDGTAKEFHGRYLHKRKYQELLLDSDCSSEKDWIRKADNLSQKYSLPYDLVADLIPKN